MKPGGVTSKKPSPKNSADSLPGFILSDGPAPVLTFALDAPRRTRAWPGPRPRGQNPARRNGVAQLLVLGLVTAPGGLAALLIFVVAGDGKAAIVCGLFLRNAPLLCRLIPLRCPAGRAAFAVADAGIGPVRIGDANAIDRV